MLAGRATWLPLPDATIRQIHGSNGIIIVLATIVMAAVKTFLTIRRRGRGP